MNADIKTFRKINHLSQKELAEYLGVGQNFISQMENGHSPLPYKQLEKIRENTSWDSSMLEEEKTLSNQQLLDLIASQQRTIEMQAHTIELLEKRGYSQDAQEDNHAGCAAVSGQ